MYQIAGFLINLGSVSLPGRFDSDVNPESMVFPWPTLVSPAGFAFAIWGVIYLGELAGLVGRAPAAPLRLGFRKEKRGKKAVFAQWRA